MSISFCDKSPVRYLKPLAWMLGTVACSPSSPLHAQNLPPAIDAGAITGALEGDGKAPDKAKSPTAPRRSAEDIRREASDLRAWQDVQLKTRGEVAENPQGAIATYKAFFESHPLHPTIAVAVTAAIAELYVRLDDVANASAIFD